MSTSSTQPKAGEDALLLRKVTTGPAKFMIHDETNIIPTDWNNKQTERTKMEGML